ncbi:MAG TPA: hypothetical protein VHU80_06640 [Polyangiaceae bacterium]|nr:hypothetical protein [Polyangiaceae bacterium]
MKRYARRRAAFAALGLCCVVSHAVARTRRPRFEPTDLELEAPGTAELDVQAGPSIGGGDTGNRFVVPDLEVDLGLLPNVEFDVDAALAFDHFDTPHASLDGEAVWTSVKLGLADTHNDKGAYNFAAGLQLGPRLPTVGTRGLGYAGLALLGVAKDRLHLVGNLGAIVDPGERITSGQAKSLVAGIDLDLDLDGRDQWSFVGELATAVYVSDDPDELTVTGGFAYNVLPSLELSAILLAGLLPGADRGAILFGVSPKVSLW